MAIQGRPELMKSSCVGPFLKALLLFPAFVSRALICSRSGGGSWINARLMKEEAQSMTFSCCSVPVCLFQGA